jgi:hypothetical protein
VAAALVNPHLLGPLSHNYASLVVCLDLLWCIWVRIYTREWGPRGQDRNLESPRKSTLDFREQNANTSGGEQALVQREARRLWFNVVTSNDAQYEDDDSDGDSDDSMPDLSVPEDSDTEDDDDIPDLDWFLLKTKSSLLPLE